ncbi:MAG: DUF4230 domain-containing protein [Spirochaetales bacterium]|nr:DUF4230 domain-containing protein [Spirochaetales bacterium]
MKSENKKRKRGRFPTRLILVLLILIAAAALIILSEDIFKINIPNPFMQTDKTAYSNAILKQVKDISRINTIEFIYKSVFPYDLIDGKTDWKLLVSRFKNGEKLSFKEIEMLSILGIASQAGIDLLDENYSFAVITARIKAGFDFTGTVFDSPETDPERAAEAVIINKKEGIIQIRLPEAVITEVIIEDADSSSYDYPDLDISPQQWKTLTSILTGMLKAEAKKRDITGIAERRGQELIRELLENSGYSQVIFIK